MPFDIDFLKVLREKSGAAIKDCKRAMEECGGDLDAAMGYLRKAGILSASSKMDRPTNNGLVAVKVSELGVAHMLELGCETDFVASNSIFRDLLGKVIGTACRFDCSGIDELMALECDENGTVGDSIMYHISVLGEAIALHNHVKLSLGSRSGEVGCYVHNEVSPGSGMGLIAGVVLLGSESQDKDGLGTLAKQIAMHVVASNPMALNRAGLDKGVVDRELDVVRAQACSAESKAPAEMMQKVIDGKMQKFYRESVLEEQVFVFDNVTVMSDLIADASSKFHAPVSILDFARLSVGGSSK